MITPDELAELALKKYGKSWQTRMAEDVQTITGCNFRRAQVTIHRLARGTSKPSPLVEVALRSLTEVPEP